METVKMILQDDQHPLFSRDNMFSKEFPSDFRRIRYFTLMIVQKAPPEIKEINLLEQQISEIIKNAVKHGNKSDPEKTIRVWYSFSTEEARIMITSNLLIMSHSEQKRVMTMTAGMPCLPQWNTGMRELFSQRREIQLPSARSFPANTRVLS